MLTHANHIPISDYFNKPKNNISFYAEREMFTNTKMIDIDSLHPNQWTLDGECLARKIKNKSTHSVIYVAFVKGVYVLIDGHHTVIAKQKSGQKRVKCKLAIIP